MTSWYSLKISQQSDNAKIFIGYFIVDDATSLITAIYDLSFPSYTDVLLPTDDAASYPDADNNYPFNGYGTNFYSEALQTFFGLEQDHFNIFNENDNLVLYTEATGTLTTPEYTIEVVAFPSPPCFKEDTKILTDKGYVPIQNLRKGDLVKTLKHEYKPINMIGKSEIYHSALEKRVKDQLYKCSVNTYPGLFEDLILTGSHSILVNDFASLEQKEKTIKVLGKIYSTDSVYRLPACVDENASVYELPGRYTIYHLALENEDNLSNYGIFANGLLVESCSKRYMKDLSNMILIE